MNKVVLVYITAPDRDTALSIAKVVVNERLAACANILEGMTSVYRWEGEIRNDSETVLILKTVQSQMQRLTERVIELHRYDVPCVVALPIVEGSENFLNWVRDEITE